MLSLTGQHAKKYFDNYIFVLLLQIYILAQSFQSNFAACERGLLCHCLQQFGGLLLL